MGRIPYGRWTRVTVIGALSLAGLIAPMSLAGSCDTDVMVAFCRHVLGPKLRPGQTVVMDNLSVHKSPRVRRLIEARGCHLVFLPPYSPDLSPIEPAWSKLKASLRRIGARTLATLNDALTTVVDEITPGDAHGFFRHCGYGR